MKVWVYVEGPSDRSALEALWKSWREQLKAKSWGIQVIPLDDKARFFRKIGAHATEKLVANSQDIVVGLPDYYPNIPYDGTPYQHKSLSDLLDLQKRLVNDVLSRKGFDVNGHMQRFYPSALKHDLEMLLLAASEQLGRHLGTNQLGNWRSPVEDQDQQKPPKRVVEQLYIGKKNRAYRDTRDAVAVLSRVTDLREILYSKSNQLQCPVFKAMLDWIGVRTGIPAY